MPYRRSEPVSGGRASEATRKIIMKTTIPIADLILDAGTQIRATLDLPTVEEYAAAMEQGADFPPVAVVSDEKHFWLVDGFHRVEAAKMCGRAEIAATVGKGNIYTAIRAALGANHTHGLKRSQADKRRAVAIAMKKLPPVSARELAKICGVSYFLVETIKKEKAGDINVTYDSKGQQNEGIQRDGFSENSDAGTGDKSPPDAPPKPEVDRTGRTIPQDLLPLWKRREVIQEFQTMLADIREAVRRGDEEKDALYANLNFQSALAHLQQAASDLDATKPYAVCPYCQGEELTRSHCRVCRTAGFVSKFQWNTIVPEEMKR